MSQTRLVVGKNFENEELGVSLMTYIDQSDEVWVGAREVALAFGYADTVNAIKRHVDPEDKAEISQLLGGDELPPYPNFQGHKKIINESGVYSLALRSKLPRAKRFRRWITDDVLPAIRKSGYYAVPEALVVIRTIEHGSVRDLEGKVRKDFRTESKTVSDLAKNPKAVEAGRAGARQFWENYRAMESRITFLENENERLSNCLRRISEDLDNSEAEEVGGWVSDDGEARSPLPDDDIPPPPYLPDDLSDDES